MKKGFFLCVLVSTILLGTRLYAAEMKAINFTQKGEVSELELLFDGNEVQASKFQVKEDKQIIVDLVDVSASDRVMQAFDTSEFSGGVVFVKAYKKPKSTKDIRIAIQLRDNVRSVLVRSANRVVLQIENRYGVFSQKKAEDELPLKNQISDIPAAQLGRYNIPKSDSVEDILENVIMSGRKKYVGKKISMNLKSIKPDDILKMIAETSGFNIVVTEDVKKLEPISLNLNDVPWDQALDTVLEMNKLVGKKNGIILLVTTFDQAVKDNEIEKKNKEALIEQDPLVTKIFPISFANITDLKSILTEYSSDAPAGGTKRGKISMDIRTNSLIVKDTSEVIERMKKIVELLDTQTPQVLIESKIVEVTERYSKEIGLDNGINFGYDPFTATANAGVNNGSFSFSSAPNSTNSLFGLSIGRLNKLVNLDFKLKLMESESKGKVVSSPKIITKNNEAAKITQDEQSYYPVTTLGATTGTTTTPTVTDWKGQTSSLSLDVTPQVTNEGSISLKVDLKKDSLSPSVQLGAPQGLTNRTVSTHVLVDNGATVVIGGIYSYASSENHSGIPFLKDIPLIGWLFRTKYNPDVLKRELIIFLTPRIINQEEAGLVDRG
jgi:type IV pilus assembly protein PilQ